MKINFRRIISSGNFIPEIDGLRFIAILSVVLYHIKGYIKKKDIKNYDSKTNLDILYDILEVGEIGVPLFFVISGFILAKPFLSQGDTPKSKINIKKYFLRRLTRLEPPYIIVMTFLLFASVYVAKNLTLAEGIKSYLSSLLYSHNFIFGNGIHPKLNGVAWSLEIEIQFYVIMPLIAFLLKKIHRISFRRYFLIFLTLTFIFIDFYETLPFRSLINYLEFFLVGILLADLYLDNKKINIKLKHTRLASLLLFVSIWMLGMIECTKPIFCIFIEIFQLTLIFGFYYLVIFLGKNKILRTPMITNIGGMCYSIYLLHVPIISFFGGYIITKYFSDNYIINTSIYFLVLIFFILLISSIFFLLIERPCMDKNWFKKLFRIPPK